MESTVCLGDGLRQRSFPSSPVRAEFVIEALAPTVHSKPVFINHDNGVTVTIENVATTQLASDSATAVA